MNDKIYTVIPKSKNIISTLVDSLHVDKTFQRHVNKLSISDKDQERKKAITINNTVKNIKVFNTKVNPLFVAKDIGVLMGISQINYLTRKFEPEEKVIGYITNNKKTKKVTFLTKHGVYRCFFASRSPLAKLFRKFVCNLMDHMIENENELMEKLSIQFQTENPKLIETGIKDLHDKLTDLETKYINEAKKNKLLEKQCLEEQTKRLDIEKENTEIDIINSYNIMHINQLKQDKDLYIEQIKTIKENVLLEDSESNDLLELKLLKQRFMKPMYVYIFHPEYFNKLLNAKIKEYNQQDKNSNSEPKIITYIKNLLLDKTYENNFNEIFNKNGICIDLDEILYFYFTFSRNVSKKDKLILVNTQWIAGKKHFFEILTSIKKNSDVLGLNKFHLFKTSINEISDIVREEFINLAI